MKDKFEYTVTATEVFTSPEEELHYLNSQGGQGWEMIHKETVAVKKRISVIATSNPQQDMHVLYKFYWKRKKVYDVGQGDIGEGNQEGAGESIED